MTGVLTALVAGFGLDAVAYTCATVALMCPVAAWIALRRWRELLATDELRPDLSPEPVKPA